MMRNNHRLSLMMALIATLSGPVAFAQPNGSGRGPGGRENPFAGLEDLLAQVDTRFVADQDRLTQNEAFQLAERLFQAIGRTLIYDDQLSTQDELVFRLDSDSAAILEINLVSGAVSINAGLDPIQGDHDTPGLPAKQDVEAAALEQLRLLGLLPPGSPPRLRHLGGLRKAIAREDGTEAIFDKLVSARFGRVLQGTRVVGPGSRIVVRLGEQGRLAGLTQDWQRLSPHHINSDHKRTKPEIVRLAMMRLQLAAPEALRKRVKRVDLVYYDDGLGNVEPAVLVVADMIFRKGGQQGEEVFSNVFDFFVPVLRESLAQFPFVEDFEGHEEPSEQ